VLNRSVELWLDWPRVSRTQARQLAIADTIAELTFSLDRRDLASVTTAASCPPSLPWSTWTLTRSTNHRYWYVPLVEDHEDAASAYALDAQHVANAT